MADTTSATIGAFGIAGFVLGVVAIIINVVK